LADLAVVGGHRGGGDEHAALAAGLGRVAAHGGGGQADHVEAAEQIDLQGLGKQRQLVRAVFAHGFGRRRYAGAVDQTRQGAQLAGALHHRQPVGLAGDVAAHKHAADFMRQRLSGLNLEVGQQHPAAQAG